MNNKREQFLLFYNSQIRKRYTWIIFYYDFSSRFKALYIFFCTSIFYAPIIHSESSYIRLQYYYSNASCSSRAFPNILVATMKSF